jgi:hypothetical protein
MKDNENECSKFWWSRSLLFKNRSFLMEQMINVENIVRSERLDLISTSISTIEIYKGISNRGGKISDEEINIR